MSGDQALYCAPQSPNWVLEAPVGASWWMRLWMKITSFGPQSTAVGDRAGQLAVRTRLAHRATDVPRLSPRRGGARPWLTNTTTVARVPSISPSAGMEAPN